MSCRVGGGAGGNEGDGPRKSISALRTHKLLFQGWPFSHPPTPIFQYSLYDHNKNCFLLPLKSDTLGSKVWLVLRLDLYPLSSSLTSLVAPQQ